MSETASPDITTIKRRAGTKVPRKLRPILSLDDFEKAAKRHLPRPIFGYVAGACENGSSFRSNGEIFDRIHFIPRVLKNVAGRDQTKSLFDVAYSHPFGIAPMGLSALAAYDGDVVLARAARAAGIPSIMSAASLTPLERVAQEVAGGWFQAYLPGENNRIDLMIDRVAAAGFHTLVITVDAPIAGNRENNVRSGFDAPLQPSVSLAWQGVTHPRWLFGTASRTLMERGMLYFENMDALRGPPILSRNLVRALGNRDQLGWDHISRIRQRWHGRLVLKGILSGEDAQLAVDHGVDGVIVSNHGGRQLDGAVAPLAVLAGIADKVGGVIPVMLDSGIRRGTDVVKAIALGADFVFLGRPFLFAASTHGENGVKHAITILAEEIDRNIALLGARTLQEVNRDHIIQRY